MYAYKSKFSSMHFWRVINVRNKEFLFGFGEQLRKIRKAQGISQRQLAFEADVSLSQISRIERGILNPTISTCFVIAKALKINLKDLFDFEMDF